MEYILLIIMAILGAAFIAGGVVGYRKGTTTKVKAISAAAVAAGIVMLVIVTFVLPASTSIG